MDEEKKIAFITGSSRGIGAAIAKELSSKGIKVALNGLEETELHKVEEEIIEQGGETLSLLGDITSSAFADQALEHIKRTWGEVNILVNNAGIEIRKPSLDYTEEDFDKVMGVNLKAAFFLTQKALPSMMKQQWGRVINISSVHESKPKGIGSIYSMTKGGMLMMTRELAKEYAHHGITFNNVAPGAISTEMNKEVLSNPDFRQKILDKIPARFIGDVADVAKVVAFLTSNEARYVNGSSYSIDGGLGL